MSVNVTLKINKFGTAQIAIKESLEMREEKPPLIYGVPERTSPNLIELTFFEGEFVVPKTTGGSL